MTWETIEPKPGVKTGNSPVVTVAAHPASGNDMTARFVVILNRAAVQIFEWRPKMRLAAQFMRASGRLRLLPAAEGEKGWSLFAQARSERLETRIRFDWLAPDTRHGAKSVQWSREEGGLVIELPEWARPPLGAAKGLRRAA